MAHMSVLVVGLTFGEVYDAPQRDRVHRGKQEDDRGDSLSVLQGRKNLKFFPDIVTGKSITLFICSGLWTRAKPQRKRVS